MQTSLSEWLQHTFFLLNDSSIRFDIPTACYVHVNSLYKIKAKAKENEKEKEKCVWKILTRPSLFLNPSWIFHINSGPAHAVCLLISKC